MEVPFQAARLARSLDMRERLERLESTTVEQTVPDRFRRVVEAFPGAPAIRSDSYDWTYRDLDNASACVAAALLDLDLDLDRATGSPVAIAMSMDAPIIAAMLGAMRAASPYVCLPPSYPEEALRPLLEHLGPGAIIGSGESLAKARAAAPSGVVVRELGETFDQAPNIPDSTGDPRDPFAILYTSGTLHSPRGVVRSHRSLLNQVRAYSEVIRIRPGDHVSMLTAPSNGAATSSVFGALLSGACLYPFDVRTAGLTRLATWLSENMISIYHSVPTLFRGLLRTLDGHDNLPILRVVKLGGESVYPADVDLFRKRIHPGCVLVNGLGITEAAGNLCYYRVGRSTRIHGRTVPVGTARQGTELSVEQANGEVVEPGQVGELVARDGCLATGYWKDPELTRERFEPLPDGRVRFRTGDLARMTPGGLVEYVGRHDRTVKVSGHAADPAVIESRLLEHPAVAEVAVEPLPRRSPGETCLCAYVAPIEGAGPTPSELIAFSADALPAFMVPQRFVTLETLPKTHNGKLDRKSLPEVTQTDSRTLSPDVRPRGSLELSISRIIEEDLCVRPVGRRDNFFELGMNSMMLMQLLAKIEQRHSLVLTPGDLLEHPAVAPLAEAIVRNGDASTDRALVELKAGSGGLPLFLVHPVKGDIMIYLPLVKYLAKEQAVYGLEARALRTGEACSEETYEAMARSYVDEIKEVQPGGAYVVGGFSAGGRLAFEVARQLGALGDHVATVIVIDSGPRHWGSTPVARGGHWSSRLKTHARRLCELPPGAWADYAVGRVRTAMRVIAGPRRSEANASRPAGLAANVLLRAGDTLRKASRSYSVTTQDLHVTLIRSEWERASGGVAGRADLGWSEFARRGGVHDDTVWRPCVPDEGAPRA